MINTNSILKTSKEEAATINAAAAAAEDAASVTPKITTRIDAESKQTTKI